MELGTKICFVTSRTYLDLYTTSIYKQTYVTSDTGIQNVMTSTSLKNLRFRDSIMQLSTNGYSFKPQKTQITTHPQIISLLPLSTFFSLNTGLIYPRFRTVRSSIFYFLKRVLKNVTNQTSLQYEIELSYLFFLLLMYTILLTYLL